MNFIFQMMMMEGIQKIIQYVIPGATMEFENTFIAKELNKITSTASTRDNSREIALYHSIKDLWNKHQELRSKYFDLMDNIEELFNNARARDNLEEN